MDEAAELELIDAPAPLVQSDYPLETLFTEELIAHASALAKLFEGETCSNSI